MVKRTCLIRTMAGSLLAISMSATVASAYHSSDYNPSDWKISLTELLRGIQFYNIGGYACATGSEDGYVPGGGDRTCAPHASDYDPQDWSINLSELLRLIQFYNLGGYYEDATCEDGFCPGTIPGANTPPVAVAEGPVTGHVESEVVFDGSQSSDEDLDTLEYKWAMIKFPQGSETTLSGAASPLASFTPDLDGDYQVQLTVNDGYVDSSPVVLFFTAINDPPVASLTTPEAVFNDEEAVFDCAGSSDYEGMIASYRIDYGDGTSPQEQATPTFSHTYGTSGTFSATLRVTDHLGAYTETSTEVTSGLHVGTAKNLSNSPSLLSQCARAALGEAGKVLVSWEEPGWDALLSVVSEDAGQTFSVPVRVNADKSVMTASSDAVFGGAGRANIVWWDGQEGVMHVSSDDAGQSWTAPANLSGIEGGISPRMAANGGSRLTVVWYDTGLATDGRAIARTSTDNGDTFNPPVFLQSGPVDGQTPAGVVAAMGPGDDVYVAWGRMGSSGSENLIQVVFSTSHDSGATFTSPMVVSSLEENSLWTKIVTGDDGTIHMLRINGWGESTQHLVYQQSMDAGDTFTPPVELATFNIGFAEADIAAGPDGMLAVTWSEDLSGTPKGWICISRDSGGSFGPPMSLYRGDTRVVSGKPVILGPHTLGFAWGYPSWDVHFSIVQLSP